MKDKLFILYFVCVLNTFNLTPLDYYANLFLSLSTLLGIGNIFKLNLFKHSFIFKGTILCCILIFLSVYSSHSSYGQDFVSGLVASRPLIYFLSPLAFYKKIKNGSMFEKKNWNMIVFLIWGYAIYYAIFSFFNFTYTFISPFSGEVTIVEASSLSKGLIFFGIIFYLLSGILRNKNVYYIYASLLFLTTQIFDIQRGDIVFLGITILIIIFTYRKTGNIRKILVILPSILLFSVLLLNEYTDTLNVFNDKFGQVFKLFGDEDIRSIDDASVYVRIMETDYAIKKISEHPLTGNGLMRSSFLKQIMPDLYFYPADVGLLGIVYVFGLIGIIIFVYMIYITKSMYKKLFLNNVYYATIFFYLLFMLLYSFKDGNMMLDPIRFSFLAIVLYYLSLKMKKYNMI